MKEQLNITIDDECPDEIKANGIAWVEDACNWLLSQPQAAPTNKAVEKLSEQEPHSEPFVIPGVDEQVASWAALYYSALGGQTESKEQCS